MVSGFLVSISLKVTVFLVVAKAAKARVTREGEKIKKRVLKRGGGGGAGGTNSISQPIFFQNPLPSVQIPFPLAEFRQKIPVVYILALLSSHPQNYGF